MAKTAATGRVNVPNLKDSVGMKAFEILVPGEYTVKVAKVEIKAPKNNSPTDVWNFTFDVLSGPPQEDGSSAKGRKAWHNVNIMLEDHPKFGSNTMGVDELKSMVIAAGVETKGNTLNPESFVGQELATKIIHVLDQNSGKTYANFRGWKAC